jgi:hypothetical protein
MTVKMLSKVIGYYGVTVIISGNRWSIRVSESIARNVSPRASRSSKDVMPLRSLIADIRTEEWTFYVRSPKLKIILENHITR